jgi:acyl-CoA synthetase (AMP-forming)/AMP-acid ligase II
VLALAGELAGRAEPGARALLLYPAGLEFIVALFACLAAGLVAVPATMADRRRAATRLRTLLDDADPALVLTASDCAGTVAAALAQAGGPPRACVCTDSVGGQAGIRLAQPEGDALAFLQYTSGSISQPRGVEVTHANLAANVEAIGRTFGFGPHSVMVSWLPLFHDMGLVGSVVTPAALGFRSVLMAPALFLRQPAHWLHAISDYRATCAGAPNFGWDLCASRVTEELKAGLELSCLEVAYNGSEPVRAATLRRFATAFAGCALAGRRRQAGCGRVRRRHPVLRAGHRFAGHGADRAGTGAAHCVARAAGVAVRFPDRARAGRVPGGAALPACAWWRVSAARQRRGKIGVLPIRITP